MRACQERKGPIWLTHIGFGVGGQRLVPVLAKTSKKDLTTLRELLETRTVTPVIDRTYGLSEVPDAIRYLEEGHARGKVVITMDIPADEL